MHLRCKPNWGFDEGGGGEREAMASAAAAGSGRGLWEGFYRLVMRRNSVYVTFVVAGAFLGERVMIAFPFGSSFWFRLVLCDFSSYYQFVAVIVIVIVIVVVIVLAIVLLLVLSKLGFRWSESGFLFTLLRSLIHLILLVFEANMLVTPMSLFLLANILMLNFVLF